MLVSNMARMLRNPMVMSRMPQMGHLRESLVGSNLVASQVTSKDFQQNRFSTTIVETPKSHARQFAIERVFAVGMLPLFPAALFVQNSFMDYSLAFAVSLHTMWGLEIVAEDYVRPFLFGETIPKIFRAFVLTICVGMFAALLNFNYNDVGITKAFQMIWSL